jgi:hypothetical protein
MITLVFAIIGFVLLSIGTLNLALAQTDNGNNTSNTEKHALNLTNTPLSNSSNMSNIITPTGNANTYR